MLPEGGWPSSLSPTQAKQQDGNQLEDGYEVMNSIGPRSGKFSSSESPKSSIVVLKEPSSPALGGTVNLILSFGNKGDSQVQVVDPPARTDELVEETSEPVHRVRSALITSHYSKYGKPLLMEILSHKLWSKCYMLLVLKDNAVKL